MATPPTRGGLRAPTQNATADRALDVLRLYRDDRTALSAVDVARELGTSRSTAYRYLQSLRGPGFVEEDERGGFRLGPAVLELARIARAGLGLSEVALPVMRRASARLGQTALLTRRSGRHVVALERVEPTSPLRLSYERGHVLPLHAGASARVLLAFAPDDEIDRLLAPGERLQRFTDRTLVDRRKLRRELQANRQAGYAVSRGEVDLGVVAVAAPIFDADGVVAALSLVDTEFGVDDDRLATMVDVATAGAHEIGERLRA